MEQPEVVIPSTVRLDSINRLYSRMRHSLYFSELLGFVFRGVIRDGKVDMSTAASLSGRANLEQGIGQMIESTPDAEEDIAADHGENRRRVEALHHIVGAISCLEIGLDPDQIGVRVKEGAGLDIQLIDVLFGPFNFRSDSA